MGIVSNPNCDGNNCTSEDGDVRYYSLGGGAGLFLCHDCWDNENAYRADRVKRGADAASYPIEPWDRTV